MVSIKVFIVLSAVWGISLDLGQFISDLAAEYGAGHFEGNSKLIVSSLGCLVTNLTWFLVALFIQSSLFGPKTGFIL